jgi:hypothetical protein
MKRCSIALAIAALVLAIWFVWEGHGPRSKPVMPPDATRGKSAAAMLDGETGNQRTNPGRRQPDGHPLTHGPGRLQAFMLPNLVIDGKTLPEALLILKAAYEETCRETGEIALPLSFVIAPGNHEKLRVHLGVRNLNTSIRLLGALAGMKVSRNGVEYRFDHIGDRHQAIKRTLTPPANLARLLKAMTGGSSDESIANQLASLGMRIDPSTELTLNDQGEVVIETGSPADFAALSAILKLLEEEFRLIQQFSASIIELPVDAGLDAVVNHWLDKNGVGQLMHDVRQTPGARILAVPSSITSNGEPATFEIYHGKLYPTESEEGDVERGLGNLLRLKGSALGFGNQLDINFTSQDLVSGPFQANNEGNADRIRIDDESFRTESGTKVIVHTRADGSKVLLVVTSTLTDPGGRPVQ